MPDMFDGKNIVITGGTGYLGRQLVRALLEKPVHSIRVFSRDEVKHHRLVEDFKDSRIRSLVGDVRDAERVRKAVQGADYVIHAAAMKRIDLIEYNVLEAVKTNVQGSINVVNACLDEGVQKVVLVSTDKACSPINSYGATKMLAERVFIESNYNKGPAPTVLTAVRYGNVTESTGSVIPYFTDLVRAGREVPLTHPDMTRFFITPKQAVEQVFKALKYGVGGEIFVPKLPAFTIPELIDVLKEHYGSKSAVKVVGIRPGEKIDEYMINEDEATRAYLLGDGYVILSQIDKYQDTRFDYLKNAKPFDGALYSSRQALVDKKEVKKILESGGILKK